MTDTPQDAATLVLIRDPLGAGNTPEVLLVRCDPEMVGESGAYAFPGACLDPTDIIPPALALSRTFIAAEAAFRVPDVRPAARALSLWIAALRATFAQAGLLLARYGDGRLWEPDNTDLQRLVQQRRAIQQGKTNFPNMMHDLERALATDLLVYFASEITPANPSPPLTRRFFLAQMPSNLVPLPDQHTVGELLWITPGDALHQHASRTLVMQSGTTDILQLLQPFPSVAAAIEHMRLQPVQTVRV
jgi:hypothetical protein